MSSVEWPDDVREFFKKVGSAIDINLYSLKCRMTSKGKSYAFAYVILVNSMPLMFLSFVLLLCLPSTLSEKFRRMRMPSPVLGLNIIFTATSAFFMVIFNFSVSLCFQAYTHPNYLDGDTESSLVAFPFLLVGTNAVVGMRIFSAFATGIW